MSVLTKPPDTNNRRVLLTAARSAGLPATAANTIDELRKMLGMPVYPRKSRETTGQGGAFQSGQRKRAAIVGGREAP